MKTLLPGKWLLVLLLISVLILTAACNSSSPSTSTITSTPPAVTTTATVQPTTNPPVSTTVSGAAPAITVTAPLSGNKFGIGDVKMSVQVTNFNLVDKLGKPNSSGEGHIHYFMDVDAPTTPGQPAVAAPGTYAATTANSYTWHNVGGGSHTFSVELVNNDHTPLVPAVVQKVTVLVIPEIGPPQLVILTPRDNAQIPSGNVTISVQAANFNLVDKLGQANVAREGHLHYFLDVDAPTAPGKPAVTAPGTYAATSADSYTWTNVAPGKHKFSVELLNNDHTPLDTPVVATIEVNVTGPTPAVTSTPSPTSSATSPAAGQSVTIDLVAQNMAFDKSSISVPAGANVTVNFNNKDAGIPHNFAVYQNLSGGQTKAVFVGETITGSKSITYHFVAPTEAGNYFFVCDIHPQIMTGSFLITP